MARNLEQLISDAGNAKLAGKTEIVVNPAELKMLKDYGLVRGTERKDVAQGNGRLFDMLIVAHEPGRNRPQRDNP